jgi:hypothetical protein
LKSRIDICPKSKIPAIQSAIRLIEEYYQLGNSMMENTSNQSGVKDAFRNPPVSANILQAKTSEPRNLEYDGVLPNLYPMDLSALQVSGDWLLGQLFNDSINTQDNCLEFPLEM